MLVTTHQFLGKYPVSPISEKLIVGTIHPHDHLSFKTQFFYGNQNSLWNILSEAFPEELSKPITIDAILSFLKCRKIAVSDTIVECSRKSNSALDSDLIPLKLNQALIDQIRNSNIEEVYFTSGFGKNSAFRLFYESILGKKVTNEIRELRGITLPESVFGRPVKLIVLYSPARTANVGLSKSKLYLENRTKFNSNRPVHEFKVWYYKQLLSL